MRTKLMLLVLAVGGLLAVTDGATVMGDDPDPRTLAVTVYNGNLGLVKDQRPIELQWRSARWVTPAQSTCWSRTTSTTC
jgi:hypothetical protein